LLVKHLLSCRLSRLKGSAIQRHSRTAAAAAAAAAAAVARGTRRGRRLQVQQQHTTRAARNASDNVHLNTGIAQRATPAMVRCKVGPSSSGNAAVGNVRGPPQQQ